MSQILSVLTTVCGAVALSTVSFEDIRKERESSYYSDSIIFNSYNNYYTDLLCIVSICLWRHTVLHYSQYYSY